MRTWLALVAVAAGCGRIGFRDGSEIDATTAVDVSQIDATVDATVPCGPLVEMADNFDDGVTGPLWQVGTNAPVTVTEAGGVLAIALATQTGFFYGKYLSATKYSLGTCKVAITVVEIPRAAQGAEAAFCLTNDGAPAHELCFGIQNGIVSSSYNDGTVTTFVTLPFDPVVHAHLRLSQDTTNVIWETSMDGIGWNVFDARPSPLDLSQARVQMYGGTYMNVANPGQARWDDLLIQ